MTEFEDIDDFISDLEKPEVKAQAMATAVMELTPQEDKDEVERREELKRDAAEFFNEEMEFTEDDVILTQESGRRVI